MRFHIPDLDDESRLFVSCDAYMCDPDTDGKPYCDRTCWPDDDDSAAGPEEGRRRRRRRRSRSRRRRRRESERTEASSHLLQGPFVIRGSVDAGDSPC